MELHFQATYEGGVLHPHQPLALPDHIRLDVTVKARDEAFVEEADNEEEVRPDAPRLTAEEFRRIIDEHALSAPRSLPMDFDRHDIYSDHD